MTDEANPAAHPLREHRIQIDRVHYTVIQNRMTGEELRHVPPTPIPETRDMYEVRPGEPDRLVSDSDVVDIRDGLRFFTAPHHINPGRAR
jgi:hypothetical protein